MSTRPDLRQLLLDAGLWFAAQAVLLPGVVRLALMGSITTDRANPKDIDFLVTVADDANLTPLAALARRLKGRTQSHSHGADVFLANEAGQYLGRTCSWLRCGPGIRASCDAAHCGRRHYLHDDLATVRLSSELVARPPLEIWPAVVRRCELPGDVARFIARFCEPHNHGVQRTGSAATLAAESHDMRHAAPDR